MKIIITAKINVYIAIDVNNNTCIAFTAAVLPY